MLRLAATAVTAPAQAEARGIGPGLAFGLAAGAIAAGAAASTYGPYYYGPGYGYYGPATMDRPMGHTPIMADRIIGTATGAITTGSR